MENKENKKKVLIVDDDENLITVLTDKLTVSGFEVISAPNGLVGWKKALEIHPDVILLDILMPDMDGWTTLEKIKEDAWGKDANIIMLTTLDKVDGVMHAMERGSFRYIVKTQHSLDEMVEQVKVSLQS